MIEAPSQQRSSPNSTERTAEGGAEIEVHSPDEVAKLLADCRRRVHATPFRAAYAYGDGVEYALQQFELVMAEARAEIERLRLQVSDAEEDVQRLHKEKCDQLDELIASRTRLSTMQAALEPFAAAVDDLDEHDSDGEHLWESPAAMSLSTGDLRRARAALSQKDGGKEACVAPASFEAMEAALKPFAVAADSLNEDHRDRSDIWKSSAAMCITAGDLRNAATVIRSLSQQSTPGGTK